MNLAAASLRYGLALAAIVLAAAALLTVGIDREWCLLHEDNGALQTAFALGHVELGLARTRGHSMFVDRVSGEAAPYGHHPAVLGLLLAGVFRVAGTTSPAAARTVPILFALGSVLLMAGLARRLLGDAAGLAAAALMALLPMSAFFGRMVNYEPVCLVFVLVFLGGVADVGTARRAVLARVAAGIFLGTLVDWPPVFFALALAAITALSRGAASELRPVARVALLAGAAAVAVDLAHLVWAAGTLAPLLDVGTRTLHGSSRSGLAVLGSVVEFGRRYLTHGGVLAGLAAVVASTVAWHRRWAQALFRGEAPLRRVSAVALLGGWAYVLSAPTWAAVHPYWQFYLVPGTVLALAIVGRWLLQRPGGRIRRTAAVLLVAEVVVTSASTLWVRHRRPSIYAQHASAALRRQFLAGEPGLPCDGGAPPR